MDENRIEKPSLLAPLVLAYIGDSIYEVYVRNRLLTENLQMPAYKLHREAVKYVRAHAQSKSVLAIEPMLSEDEICVYKRGRNAKSPTVPKNADVADYRRATGFEALVGFLYLSNKHERLNELMSCAYENALDN